MDEIKFMNTEEKIHEQRFVWMSKNYPEPDTIIMSPKTLWDFINYIQSLMPYHNFITHDGKYKYMGMDLIDSRSLEDNEVRVCKTKIL